MENNDVKKTPIFIDDKQYFVEDMSDQQRIMFNHVVDLENKLSAARFNLDQLQVSRDAFFDMLKSALQTKPESITLI